jgi:Putative peptidoglycan binding domain
MARTRAVATYALIALLSAGSAYGGGDIVSAATDPDNPNAPPDARPGACYARAVTPAVIETVTEQVLISPAQTGPDPQTGKDVVLRPAIYSARTEQRITTPRQKSWFETLCPPIYSEKFVTSLQRALTARGYLRNPPSGWVDAPTRRAIRKYQKSKGLNSGVLAVATAQDFGLIVHDDYLKYQRP